MKCKKCNGEMIDGTGNYIDFLDEENIKEQYEDQGELTAHICVKCNYACVEA